MTRPSCRPFSRPLTKLTLSITHLPQSVTSPSSCHPGWGPSGRAEVGNKGGRGGPVCGRSPSGTETTSGSPGRRIRPIQAIAEKAGILEDELELYGRYKAKIDYMGLLARLKDKPDGKIINVTAITPTPLGEGKTVTAIGLIESMNAIGIDTMLAYSPRQIPQPGLPAP